jgi:LPS sulfotransferase NodH
VSPALRAYVLRPWVTPFVILFLERDGSTYLTSLLDAHPEIVAAYERFAVLREEGATAAAQLDWARSHLTAPLIGRARAIGFKTKLVDVLDPDGFARLLRDRHCRILQMRRRNHVKAVISRINALRLHEATGNWNLYREADRLPPLEVDPDQFAEFLSDRRRAETELQGYVDALGLPTLRLEYEELLRDRTALLRAVFEFLRVRPLELDGRPLKNTSDDLRQAVANFDVLKAAYVGTGYETMFDERIDPAG